MRHRSDDVASCREVGRVLQAWLDGESDEITALRVARHLEACRRCGLEANVYQAIKDALTRRRPDPGLPLRRLRDFATRLAEQGPEVAGR